MKALVIEKADVKANIAAIRRRAGSAEITADLSGGGQGMGLVGAARLLREEGIRSFAVSEAGDAVQLRKNGFTEERILLLRSVSDAYEIKAMLENDVTLTVGSYDAGIALNGMAEEAGMVAEARISIDTGLGHYGFLPDEKDKVLKLYRHMANLAISGLYTRLSYAGGREAAEKRHAAFISLVDALRSEGIDPGTICVMGSEALFNCDLGQQAEVCVGSAIIGRTNAPAESGLVRVGHIEASLEEMRWLPKGSLAGSGAAARLKRPTLTATLDVGWYNGTAAAPSSRTEPLFRRIRAALRGGSAGEPEICVNGKKARVLGRAGMTSMALNVTKCQCKAGDVAMIKADPRMVRGLLVDFR